MIRDAYEQKEITIKNERYKQGFEKAVNSVMRAIEKASERGYRQTCFNPSVYWYTNDSGLETYIDFYDQTKKEFKKHGYTFKPTGYVGGVWQRTEEICW